MVALWICLCTLLSCAGWLLSAVHALHRTGYLVIFAVAAIAVAVWQQQTSTKIFPSINARKIGRRFRRLFPLAFLGLAGLAILGGIINPPNNYDALAYRVPRMLHWLAAEQWHWVHADFPRLNTRSCGTEWVLTPMIAFLKTDRWLFVSNAISFLLLPGLIFSLFTRVGVRRRVAWHWMWLLPSAYGFLLQAGSIANDIFGVVFPLAALDFALRARQTQRASAAVLSMLAAALFTGAKTSNLPLLLPWLVAFLPTWRLWFARPLAFLLTIPFAVGASFLPMAILNWRYCGDWTGAAAESVKIGVGPMWLYLLNNSINLSLQNLVPPIFPLAAKWNALAPSLMPAWLQPMLEQHFEPSAARWGLGEMQAEESAGLGFGITVLLGLSVLVVTIQKIRRHGFGSLWPKLSVAGAVCAAAWVSLFYVMSKIGLSGVSRFFTPYFLLVIMGLLRNDNHEILVRRKWWRGGAIGVFLLAALLVVVSNARPLWPCNWIFQQRAEFFATNKLGQRIKTVYQVYAARYDGLAPLRAVLPSQATVVGIMTYDDLETSLWRPFGSRRILHVKADDSGAITRQRGIRYVLVQMNNGLREPWEDWLRRMNARELWSGAVKYRAAQPPIPWRLVELNSEPGTEKMSGTTAPDQNRADSAKP